MDQDKGRRRLSTKGTFPSTLFFPFFTPFQTMAWFRSTPIPCPAYDLARIQRKEQRRRKKKQGRRSENRNTKRGGVEKAKRTEEVRGAKPRKWATSKGMRKNKEKKARNRTVALREHQTNLGTSKKNGRLKESTPHGGVLARRDGIRRPFCYPIGRSPHSIGPDYVSWSKIRRW